MKRSVTRILTLTLLLAACTASAGWTQDVGNGYAIADRLLQQQEYEEAYAIFSSLHRSSPGEYHFLDKAIECLVSLKRYGEAVDLVGEFIRQQPSHIGARVRLGEIRHISGEADAAMEIWYGILERSDLGLQHYLLLARTMRDRRLFDEAISVYETAAGIFRGSPLVTSEIANTHLMAGNYEEAMGVYLELLDREPYRIDDLQTTLLRYNDEYLYDIAILEIEDFMPELPSDNPVYLRLHQLHLWLLMERQLHERALATALRFEEQRSEVNYSLYSIGRQLAAEREFALAEKAFRYYIDRNIPSVIYRSMHELAEVYIRWGDWLKEYSLNTVEKRDSLYQAAFDLLDELRGRPSYREAGSVLVLQSELALDYLHRPESAEIFLSDLRQLGDSTWQAEIGYLEGRIHLYRESYGRARVALTRSNSRERIGALAEKTRYYLALSDFYEGDFEFAAIQLNALERQSTSWFANDAVRLRVWIQEGLAADSTGALLREFSGAVRGMNHGADRQAAEIFRSIIRSEGFHPLKDDALLQLALEAEPEQGVEICRMLERYIEGPGAASPLRERLMWERARIADQLLTRPSGPPAESGIPQTTRELISLYEEILLDYPGGFYGSHSRNRIQELQNIET